MNVLITAGPTYEKIDPVRFIGNYSSGKMGYAIAEVCAKQNFNVTLISGPVSISINHPNVNLIKVESAAEMYAEVQKYFNLADVVILAAAVADFTPVIVENQKIKRLGDNLILTLKPTVDIASALGKLKRKNQFIVGFALETNDEINHAIAKMKKKNFDFIVLNSLNDKKACFGYDTNKITIIHSKGDVFNFDLKPKCDVAVDIVNMILKYYI